MSTPSIFLCSPVRTAIGAYGGTLKDLPTPALAGHAIRATLTRANVDGSSIDGVVLGQVVQAGAKMNPARQAAMTADIPATVDVTQKVQECCASAVRDNASALQSDNASKSAQPKQP